MFVVVAMLKIKPEALAEFSDRLKQHVRLSMNEGRCRAFHVHQSTQDNHEFLYYEEYENKAAFDAHIDSSRVREHVDGTSSMIDGEIWFAQWNRVSDDW
jgi:quinol monooxygenase YgiN